MGLASACSDDGVADTADFRDALAAAPDYEGEFATYIADNLDGSSTVSHVLKNEGHAVDIELPPHAKIERGSLVRAWGEYDEAGKLHVDDYEVVRAGLPTERLIDAEFNPARRVAFVHLYWEGQNPTPDPDGDAKVFSASYATSANNYYQEASFGKEKITGRSFGPYAVPKPAQCDGLGREQIGLEARRLIKEDYPTSDSEFLQFMYYIPNWGACEWGGIAEVGTPESPARDTWYNEYSGCVVLVQELGHNYGMYHSKSYQCQGGPYSDDCEFEEYGHPHDPMGGGCGHMNPVQKGYMGWLEECNVTTATADGTFNLMPTELPCNGAQALRFRTGDVAEPGDERWYYLEYRRPLGGFKDKSSNLNGVLVAVAEDYYVESCMDGECYQTDSTGHNYLLDMGGGYFMHQGDAYTDHNGAVTFRILEEHSTHAVIGVEFPGGGDGQDPTCRDDSTPPTQGGHYGTLECAASPVGPDDAPPTVEITYPNDGDFFETGAEFDITVDAQDDRGVASVALYIDGEKVSKDFTDPFTWPVGGIPNGEYQFGVVASDGPHDTQSEPITIYVGDPPPEEEETDGGEEEDTGDEDTGGTDEDGGSTDEDAGAGDGADEGGCGCSQHQPRGGWAFGALLFGIAFANRRRRS
jgi:hypothetical protein